MADAGGQGLPRRVLALGATSAIAEATLRILAEQGGSFVLAGRNAQKLDAVRSDLLTRGARGATVLVADLDDTAAHPVLLAQAVEALGGIDLALLAHGVLGEPGGCGARLCGGGSDSADEFSVGGLADYLAGELL